MKHATCIILSGALSMVPATRGLEPRLLRHVVALLHEALVVCALIEGVTVDEFAAMLRKEETQ